MQTPHTSLALAALASLIPSVSAQAIFDDFNYPDGPVPSGIWTTHTGSWAIRNGKVVESPSTLGHKYMTRNGASAFNCAVEIDSKWSVSVIQAGGVVARHGGSAVENCVMGKVQSNSTAPLGYNYIYLYEYPPGAATTVANIAPPMVDVRVRLIVLGAEARFFVDADRNGTFEMAVGPRALTQHPNPGLAGVVTGNSPTAMPTEMDNWAFYDAVLVPQAASAPKIGTAYKMDLHTPAQQITPFAAVLAFNAGRITLGNRAIPLALDPMLDFSLQVGGSLGLFGITDVAGRGVPTLNIPNLPVLVGLGLFVSAFTLDGAQPFGVGYISNNNHFVIEA